MLSAFYSAIPGGLFITHLIGSKQERPEQIPFPSHHGKDQLCCCLQRQRERLGHLIDVLYPLELLPCFFSSRQFIWQLMRPKYEFLFHVKIDSKTQGYFIQIVYLAAYTVITKRNFKHTFCDPCIEKNVCVSINIQYRVFLYNGKTPFGRSQGSQNIVISWFIYYGIYKPRFTMHICSSVPTYTLVVHNVALY